MYKLKYIDKIGEDKGNVYTAFGKIIHDKCQSFFTTKEMNIELTLKEIKEQWEKEGYGDIEGWSASAVRTLNEIPGWFDTTFPTWKPVAAEQLLFEKIENHEGLSMKGFIDAVIVVDKKKRGKTEETEPEYWIIDYKTCNYFWRKEKIIDPTIYNQLVLYKHYWCLKTGIPLNKVRCGFLLLRRNVPKTATNSCLLLPVSVGPVAIEKALKWVNNMIVSVKKGVHFKNRNSCTYCMYKNTVHCPD